MAGDSFLKCITKDLEKSGYVVGDSGPPRYWYSTGNYVLNKILGGSFHRGIPQGRVTGIVGSSGTGKSFMIGNLVREVLKVGDIAVVLDSEHALDDEFVAGVGVDPTSDNYIYIDIGKFSECKKAVSKFTTSYNKQYGRDEDAPRIVLFIDSLGMLITDTEEAHYEKGISKGDQGQRSKQAKAMLREFVQAIKHFNLAIVVTDGVYKNQDLMNGEGVWIVNDAEKYSLSQIALLSKLKLKDKNDKKNVLGIRMVVEGYKSRFTRPYQTVTIEVPYETGMDPYNGLLEVAIALDIVTQKGSYYYMPNQENGWRKSVGWDTHKDDVLRLCEEQTDKFLDAGIDDDDLDTSEGNARKKKRAEKHLPKE